MAIDQGAEKTEKKHAMGSVADKIAAQGRSKIIDLAAWREGKENLTV